MIWDTTTNNAPVASKIPKVGPILVLIVPLKMYPLAATIRITMMSEVIIATSSKVLTSSFTSYFFFS